jgi:hypothetical protein
MRSAARPAARPISAIWTGSGSSGCSARAGWSSPVDWKSRATATNSASPSTPNRTSDTTGLPPEAAPAPPEPPVKEIAPVSFAVRSANRSDKRTVSALRQAVNSA